MSLMLTSLLCACSTTTPTGIRGDYKEKTKTLKTITLTPFYSVSQFGYSNDAHQAIKDLYQKAAQSWLTSKGYQVTDARSFEQQLTEQGIYQTYKDGMTLNRSLATYFERDPKIVSAEIATLKTLHKTGKLKASALLFGEIVYQSDALCQQRASEYTKFATIKTHGKAPKAFPKPCITSHFQAKLVDPQTGLTMWYNRAMTEYHVPDIEPIYIQSNINDVIRETLGNDDGLK